MTIAIIIALAVHSLLCVAAGGYLHYKFGATVARIEKVLKG